jgi:hypothetical protein
MLLVVLYLLHCKLVGLVREILVLIADGPVKTFIGFRATNSCRAYSPIHPWSVTVDSFFQKWEKYNLVIPLLVATHRVNL